MKNGLSGWTCLTCGQEVSGPSDETHECPGPNNTKRYEIASYADPENAGDAPILLDYTDATTLQSAHAIAQALLQGDRSVLHYERDASDDGLQVACVAVREADENGRYIGEAQWTRK